MNAEQKLRALAAEKILIFDGGYGTSIQKHCLLYTSPSPRDS